MAMNHSFMFFDGEMLASLYQKRGALLIVYTARSVHSPKIPSFHCVPFNLILLFLLHLLKVSYANTNTVMLHVHWTYISTLDMAMSSFLRFWSQHTLISMSSLVGDGSSLWNHGGLLKEQQVLLEPHPAPSHKGHHHRR